MFLEKRQETELITMIEGSGEIPLKFAYMGDGAYNWDKIAGHRSVGLKGEINSLEGELLRLRVSEFISTISKTKKIKKLNLIDVGCGNGMPVLPIMEELKSRKIQFQYVPIDISKELLELASKNIAARMKGVNIIPFTLDFERGNFSDIVYDLKAGNASNLMLFLGSTLGNHSDRHRVLTNFKESMTSDDFLLSGVELTNISRVNKILSHYEYSEIIGNFLYFIPEKIGVNRKDTTYSATWNSKDNQVEIRMTLKKNINVKIGTEKFTLEKDESILLARSRKFTESSFTRLFSTIGFRSVLLATNNNYSYMLSLVQPTRHSA